MLAAQEGPNSFVNALSKRELFEMYSCKISRHEAKKGYSYPTIRLPHTLSMLAGLSTKIYQTVHEGALAFLVVISPKENAAENPKSSVFTRRRSPVRIRPSPWFFLESEARTVAEDKEEELPTSEELPTNDDGDESGTEKPETVIENYGGSIVVHSRLPDGSLDDGLEFLTEELIAMMRMWMSTR